MDNILILEATEVNVNNYRELRLEALRKEPQAFGSAHKDHVNLPIDEWKKWLNNYVEGKDNWMVFASINGKLVGMIGAFQNNEGFKNKTVQIIAMYVSKDSRGKGISKLLMQALLNKLQKLVNVRKVFLDVNTDQNAAINLYKSFGFSIIGTDNPVLGDGKVHEVYLMEKVL